MITDSFDPAPGAIVEPGFVNRPAETGCGRCVATFSAAVVAAALERFPCREIARVDSVGGPWPIYLLEHRGVPVAFYKTMIGASGAGACIEEARCITGADKFIMFGSCGCLDRSIPAGAVIVPTHAYRDEGLSYHYAPPADYIALKNADRVSAFFEGAGIPCVRGRTWTTDGLYRETRRNMELRRAEGCVAVEMECAGVQAVCDYRGLEFYDFLINGDLLDCDRWDQRILGTDTEAGHQLRCFYAALDLAASL